MTERRRGWSLPLLHGRRGAGFGNEAIAWGKAFIGAQELGLRVVHPAWALNPRGYRRDFGTSRFDHPIYEILKRAPGLTVTTEMASQHDDYAHVMRALPPLRRGVVVRHASGMSGGYLGIWRARKYLRAQLETPAHVTADMYRIADRRRRSTLTVAMHVRTVQDQDPPGDFEPTSIGPRPGEFNKALPIGWYDAIARHLREHFGSHLELIVVANDPGRPEVEELMRRHGAVRLPDRAKPFLSDALLMGSADLLVCSISALSLFAAFISGNPYVWYRPHLHESGGWLSIWGDEGRQPKGTAAGEPAPARNHALLTRGVAVGDDGELPEQTLAHLADTLALRSPRHDLIEYGVIPAG